MKIENYVLVDEKFGSLFYEGWDNVGRIWILN